MKLKLILAVLFVTNFGYSQAQEHRKIYNLSALSMNIGELTVTKLEQGDLVTYSLNSEATVKFFGTTKVITTQKVVYKDGVMQSSHYVVLKNNKPYDRAIVTLENGVYTINREGKVTTMTSPITFSSIVLFFEQPSKTHSVFAELEGINKKIEPSGSNTYTLTDPENNHKNTYVYVKTSMKSAKIAHTLLSFNLTLKE